MTRDRVAALRRRNAVHSGIFALLDEVREDLEAPIGDLDHELVSMSLGDAQELVHLHAELTHAPAKKGKKK